jgi:hypothetical protein
VEPASIARRSFRRGPYGRIIYVQVPVFIHWTITQ